MNEENCKKEMAIENVDEDDSSATVKEAFKYSSYNLHQIVSTISVLLLVALILLPYQKLWAALLDVREWFGYDTFRLAIGIVISGIGGGGALYGLVSCWGWPIVEKLETDYQSKNAPGKFIWPYGTAERVIYTLAFTAKKPELVGFWLAFKAITTWGQPIAKQVCKHTRPYNISMYGEAMNVLFGLLGAAVAKGGFWKLL